MTIHNSNNKAMAERSDRSPAGVDQGRGPVPPHGQAELFLPLMTQMVKVGEETGSLDNTLDTVADSFEMEAATRPARP
jgi:type IV pilus assembly protein PilC